MGNFASLWPSLTIICSRYCSHLVFFFIFTSSLLAEALLFCKLDFVYYVKVLVLLSSHLFWASDLWTHQPGSHRRKATQDFSPFLLRWLPQFLSREGFSRLFLSSTVKSNFVYPRINHSPLVGHGFSIFIFFVRKNPNSCDCTEIRTHVPTSEGFEVTN